MSREDARTEAPQRSENARLLAAAPELLEACKAVLHAIQNDDSGSDNLLWIKPPYQSEAVHESSVERLRAAIEKAEANDGNS